MNKHSWIGLVLLVAPLFAETPLSLSECVDVARKGSTQVKQSQQAIQAAKAKKDQANTHWYPTVSAQATAIKARDFLVKMDNEGGDLPVYNGNPSTLDAATQYAYMPSSSVGLVDQMGVAMVSVVQPIYMGGRIQTGNQLANLGVDVAKIQAEQTEKDVVLSAMDRYRNLVALHATRQTILDQMELMDSLQREVRLAFRAGLATSRDTLELAQRQSEVRNYLLDIDAGIPLAEKDLCRSLDSYCSGTLTLTDTLGPIENPSKIQVDHDKALDNRPESKLLQKSVEAQDLQGELNQGELRPEVMVGAAVMEMGDFRTKPTNNAIVFANVSVNLTGFWEGAYRSRESKSNKEKAVLESKEMKSLLRLQMDQAWNELNSKWRGVQLAEQRLHKERVAMSDSRLQLVQGVVKSSDLLTAQLALQAAEDSRISASKAYLQSRANYLKVTGRDPAL